MTGRRIDYFDDPDAPRPTRIVPAVTAAVVNDAGQLLMIRRTDNDQWAIPGGQQEVGETPVQAARREVLEETGIRCEVTALVGIFSNPRYVVEYTSNGEVRQQFSICFRARYLGGQPTASEESAEVRWVARNELDELPIHPSMRLRIDHGFENRPKPYIG